MKSTKFLACVLVAAAALDLSAALSAQPSGITTHEASQRKQYKHAVMLYDRGIYERACVEFEHLSSECPDVMVEGYKVLCALNMQSENFSLLADEYELQYPYSVLLPKIRMQHGLVLFDRQDYVGAAKQLSRVEKSEVGDKQLPEYLYKRAYCDYQNGEVARAAERFREVDKLPQNNYSAPARFALGYISYDSMRFRDAVKWFDKASLDPRFIGVADYYNIDSHFNLQDYSYVVKKGPAVLNQVQDERKAHLARIISESYLVLGDVDKAKELYDNVLSTREAKTREDLFFAGSIMYAVQDWNAAIENYSKIEDRTDSLGQVANYNMAYCYIRTRNKVEAMNSFKAAARQTFDKTLQEDATFNWAKLAFDLNNDSSVFKDYIEKYPVRENNDKIYSYIAVAALRNHDYIAAVDAFDKIDELDDNMKRNYMKSNFLRAAQLIADESYQDAIPYLKSAAYYSSKNSPLNQLSRYWLAEAYYRQGKYEDARNLYTELYNISALDSMDEGKLIPYNIAYCYFKDSDFSNAIRWFDEYLGTRSTTYTKGATLRKADCYFMLKDYRTATGIYEGVVNQYGNVNDIYPYFQAGLCQGLLDNTNRKIDILLPVKKADPGAKYYPEALCELGRAYVKANKISEAKACFNQLMDHPADSSFYAKSAIEMGMIERNAKNYDGALTWYKSVVEKMPFSPYTEDALAAIESVYEIKNEPKQYLAYLASIGRAGMKSEAEKEQMIFNAAEQLYLSEDYGRALKSLEEYLSLYPGGANNSNAYFYMGECYKSLGQKEKACECYSRVAELGSDSYLELAMLNFASISYGLQRYEDAFGGYRVLLEKARMESNKYTAEVGMMRAAYRARRYDDAIAAANVVKEDIRSESDMQREADYVIAKSYLQTSRRDEAFKIFEQLSKQPKTAEGAEARYLLILDAYDKGFLSTAINMTFDFSDDSQGYQQYWLAKAFIVLGDCYAEQGDLEQAKATFESILAGYDKKDDDILENVKLRLAKL